MKKGNVKMLIRNLREMEENKQCAIHVVGCSETELVCDHKWELKFNSAMYIVGKKCRKCEQYIVY